MPVENTRKVYPEPSNDVLYQNYLNGYDAYYAGVEYGANPHTRGECHDYWVSTWHKGWFEAAEEDSHVWNARKDRVEVKHN